MPYFIVTLLNKKSPSKITLISSENLSQPVIYQAHYILKFLYYILTARKIRLSFCASNFNRKDLQGCYTFLFGKHWC